MASGRRDEAGDRRGGAFDRHDRPHDLPLWECPRDPARIATGRMLGPAEAPAAAAPSADQRGGGGGGRGGVAPAGGGGGPPRRARTKRRGGGGGHGGER